MRVRSARPSMSCTVAASTLPAPCAIAWSRIDSASRTEPSAARAICRSASGSASTLLLRGDRGEMLDQHRRIDAAEVEALAARQHRHRHLADLGRGEDELHMRRRLFQRLQQAVEGLLREHVHFVDDVDLVARRDRRVARRIDDVADVVDAGVRGGVHLQHVGMAALHDGAAMHALDGEIDVRRAGAVLGLEVQAAGEDARRRGLADAAHAGQHPGVRDAAGGERVAAACAPSAPGRSGRRSAPGGICGRAPDRPGAGLGHGLPAPEAVGAGRDIVT